MTTTTEYPISASNESLLHASAHSAKSSLSYNFVAMTSGLLLFFDIICLLSAASFSTFIYTQWLAPLNLASGFGSACEQAALVAAVLVPFILFDRRFGTVASRGQMPLLMRSYALRFTLFAGVALTLGAICQALEQLSAVWLLMWFSISLSLTGLTRVAMARWLRRLQRQGVLTEVIAVVGAGPVADRLVRSLRQSRPDSLEFLGIFDDKILGAPQSAIKATGSVADLIELGKTRKIDWILLTLPSTADVRIVSIVQRLKALSVPIGLCPQHVGSTVPYHTVDYVGGNMPVSLLADRPAQRWDAVIKAGEEFLPRWIITLAMLPVTIFNKALASLLLKLAPIAKPAPAAKLTFQFDNYDLAGFTNVAANFGQNRYGYVVTPNADHMIRLHEDASFRALYAAASYVLLDSRFLAKILRITKGLQLPVCTGSDLTAKLFSDVIKAEDSLVLIGGSVEQAQRLCARYGIKNLAHYNPPMGFIRDPKEVEACLRFIENHSPFRFCLLAVGAPQQELIAQNLKARGIARGLALCIGASINFLTGDERRAPVWMQQCGMEWLFRLLQAPGRMAKRYLVRGPRVFGLLRQANIVLRKNTAPVLRLVPSSNPPTLPAAPSSAMARAAALGEREKRDNRAVSAST